jgi:RND superfamily putative drug exporter
MASFLQKTGTRMFERKWWVVSSWIAILAVVGALAFHFMAPLSSSISIPGTQAQKALDRFEELFPDAGAKSGRLVLAAPDGKTLNDYQAEINDLTKAMTEVPDVATVISPFTNTAALVENGRIGYITVQLSGSDTSISEETATKVNEQVDRYNKDGLEVYAGGDLVSRAPGEILGIGEVAGVVIALVVLVVTLGSLVAAGLPIITALLTVGISMAGLFALTQTVEMTNTAPVLAVMLGLAVGIDYSLFIINRYKSFVKEGYSLRDAVGRAIATAGNAVLFAAATVFIALAALSVVQIPFMTVMGLAAACTVALAAMVAITLVPALLGIAGLRAFSKKERRIIQARQSSHKIHEEHVSHSTFWYRAGEKILKYRKSFLLLALAVVVVLAWPISQLKLGLPSDEYAKPGSSELRAYQLISEGFGAGFNAPLLVLVENLDQPSEQAKASATQQLVQQFASSRQSTPQTPEQQASALKQLQDQAAVVATLGPVAERIKAVDGVSAVQPAFLTANGESGFIQVIPSTGPSDNATKNLVNDLRSDETQKKLANGTNETFAVTGSTAVQIDIENKLSAALPIYLSVVVGLSLILLLVAFRSVLIPIKATLGFLLSVLAMFGALVAVFQWGWFGITDAPGPIVSFIPIIAVGILFGLAMDYEFFVVSGMQEAYHRTKDAKKAVIRGFALGSKVVVAAGFIMVAVFAGFITNHDSTIQSIGFALALGILVDAFIVRLVIVPIIMSYLGKGAWWIPKWLNKLLPNISVEGAIDESEVGRKKR